MQCPNCSTETPITLPRCVKCDAPLHRRSSSYDQYETNRPGRSPLSSYDPPYDPYESRRPGGTPPYDPYAANPPSSYELYEGYEDGSDSGYGSPENWEPAPEWHPEWLPPERAAAPPASSRPVSRRPGSRRREPRQAERPAKSGHPLLVAMIIGVVLGAAVAVGIVVWPSGDRTPTQPDSAAQSGSGTPKATSHAQATAINDLLDEMAATRTTLVPAMTDASRCDGIDPAIDKLDRVRQERQDQLAKAKALKVDALPDGADLRETLTRAAGYSLDADKAFLAWAKANQGCTDAKTPRDADFKRGHRLSADHATPEKENFVELWNPVAQDEGLPTRSPRKL